MFSRCQGGCQLDQLTTTTACGGHWGTCKVHLKWALIGVVVVMVTFPRLLSSDFLYPWSWWRVGQVFGHVTEGIAIGDE